MRDELPDLIDIVTRNSRHLDGYSRSSSRPSGSNAGAVRRMLDNLLDNAAQVRTSARPGDDPAGA
jgi:hypothetical protein